MLEPMNPSGPRAPVSIKRPVSAPVNGWSDRALTDALGAQYAAILENFIPEEDGVVLRDGYTSHVTGIGETVYRLLTYASGTTNKLFAATTTDIYDVTSAGAVGAASVSSLTSGYWSHLMFSTSGGDYLVATNGADGVRTFDGSSWATQTITGVTAANLIYVAQHKKRLWFIEENTMSAWYLGTLAISGAATEFPLGSLFKRGGSLKTIFSWSRDGGDGQDDIIVFMTDQGEIAMYQGTDPGSDFLLVGIFSLDRPMSRECWVKTGADVMILTRSGPISMGAAFTASDISKASSKDIRQSSRDAATYLPDADGWQMVHYEKKGWFFANVPVSTTPTYDQFLLNSINGRWGRLKDIPASWWGILSGDLYFASPDGTIYKAFDGQNDNGANIVGRIFTGFDTFGSGQKKSFIGVNVYTKSEVAPTPIVEIRTDFSTKNSDSSATTFQPDFASLWDVALWDVSDWAPAATARHRWFGVSGDGVYGSIYVQTESKNATLKISAFEILYENSHGF